MATAAMGTKLIIGSTNAVAELTGITGMDLSADTIETTNLDSAGWRSYIQGVRDAGEVSCSGYFKPGDTNGQKALYDAFTSGTLTNFKIDFPAALGADWTFSGIVTGISTDAQMEDSITFECTIKVTGSPTLTIAS